PGSFACDDIPRTGGTSRRQFLKSGGAIAAGGGAAQMLLTGTALAEATGTGNSDPELGRVQGQRRILLKGGVVLTVDPRVGDFAQADGLIEGGKIREIRPNI